MRGTHRTARLGARALLCTCLALLVGSAPAGAAKPKTTVQRTINGAGPDGGFSALGYERGDRYRVRDALIRGQHRLRPKRRERRRSLAYFGQISDLQLADEESPARVEWFDGDPSAGFSNSGFRPNEALNPHSIDSAMRAVNGFYKSPLEDGRGRRATMANVMLTGDLADNMQRNEVAWVRTLIEGGELDPNSGVASAGGPGCLPGPPPEDPRNYSGVQDYDDYGADNPLYYDPEDPRGAYAEWPVLPGLLDRAQEPFAARGLRAPSYSVLGNHDVLFQGTIAAQPGFEDVALGCLKYTTLVPGSNAASLGSALDPAAIAAFAAGNPGQVALVPGDPARAFVNREQYKAILAEGTQADAHGFGYVDPAELAASDGHASYYSFKPEPGVRFIALDTNAEAGVVYGEGTNGSEGNLDDPQWRWLKEQLDAAERRDELVLAFAHHPIQSMTNDFADELSPCGGSDSHGHGATPSCDADPRSSAPLHLGNELRDVPKDVSAEIERIEADKHELVRAIKRERVRAQEAGADLASMGFLERRSNPAKASRLRSRVSDADKLIARMDDEGRTLEKRAAALGERLRAREDWLIDNAPVVRRRFALERELWWREHQSALAAEVAMPTYLRDTVGERPLKPSERGAWRQAVQAIETYRHRWGIDDPGSALGREPKSGAQKRDRADVEHQISPPKESYAERSREQLSVERSLEL